MTTDMQRVVDAIRAFTEGEIIVVTCRKIEVSGDVLHCQPFGRHLRGVRPSGASVPVGARMFGTNSITSAG